MDEPSVGGAIQIRLKGEELWLLPDKALFWPKQQALVVSDIHLGKAGHFRKNGIPVPAIVHHHDLYTLTDLCQRMEVRHLIFLGDLFHSDPNAQWRQFEDWTAQYATERMTLVKGNHDILPDDSYTDLGLKVVDELILGPFFWTHEKELKDGFYNISGHLHPAIRLRGAAKQGMKIPCFYFSPDHGYMPAFGKFTGLYALKKKKEDKAFGIANGQVFSMDR